MSTRAKCKGAERRAKALYPRPEFDLLAFISVVAACELVAPRFAPSKYPEHKPNTEVLE